MLGSAFGQTVEHVVPAIAGPTGIYALIGMGAVFAGAARAPITAIVILFELTGEYSIILPMMLAIVLATGISHLVSRDTVYTLKLMRRGMVIDDQGHYVGTLRAHDLMDALAAGEFTSVASLAQQVEPVTVDGQVGSVLH